MVKIKSNESNSVGKGFVRRRQQNVVSPVYCGEKSNSSSPTRPKDARGSVTKYEKEESVGAKEAI